MISMPIGGFLTMPPTSVTELRQARVVLATRYAYGPEPVPTTASLEGLTLWKIPKDALGAHSRDEFGLSEALAARSSRRWSGTSLARSLDDLVPIERMRLRRAADDEIPPEFTVGAV